MSESPKSPKSPKGEDCLILTVNSRLARWLLLEHNEKQMASGFKVWSTPQILPLAAWLKQVWMQSWPDKYILTDLQSNRLWEEIVQNDPQQNIQDLLHLSETAKRAAEAHALIRQYRLPGNKEFFSSTEESRAFHQWMTCYETRLNELGALDPASTMDAVSEAMGGNKISVPDKITFSGFEEITPQFEAWLAILKDRGASIRFHPEIEGGPPPSLKSQTTGKNIEVREFPDSKSEAIHCSRWVRAKYKLGKKIGIVVIDLQSYRSLLIRELKAELAPASIFPSEDRALPFNLSLGPTLWEEPMINIVAKLLSIHEPAVPLKTFTAVLRSPYLNVGQALSPDIHTLENKLFRRKTLTVFLSELEKSVAPGISNDLKILLLNWQNYSEQTGQRLPSQWATTFTHFLSSLGWPGAGRTLTSREYQVYETWKNCLDEFAALDAVLDRVHRQKAVEVLLSMLKEHPFQEKTDDQPIQVVGLLESSGMRFDHLWVMGCSAKVLPALPSPNPFLPVEIRKKHNLPHSTAQRELEFAENSLHRLLNASTNIVFSYPIREKNIDLIMSPLISSLETISPDSQSDNDEIVSHRLKDQFQPEPTLESFEESSLLPTSESERILFKEKGPGGGYRFLKNQADCPFRSFANHRLNTQREEFPELDFDHQERGTLVHRILEIFWKQTRTRDALLKLQQEDLLESSVRDSVQKAFNTNDGKFARQNLFFKLEMDCVQNLILEWLIQETHRSPFEVVELENEHQLEISGLKIRLRIDRIDKLEDGKVILIDYKTGKTKASPADWFGERIQEPQLPLYAFHTSPQAIAFAQVKKGEPKLKGAFDSSFSDQGLMGIVLKRYSNAPTWEDQLQDWRSRLMDMANEFISGQTRVDPIKGPTTCRHCDLQTLCRIGEIDQGSRWNEDEE